MALLSISQAAREWKTSRSRLYALKADGKLSFSAFPDGRPALDTGELVRALGEPNGKQATPPQHTPGQPDQTGLAEQNRLLSVQLEVTERERDSALADKDRLMGILENQTRLLQGPETAQDKGKAGGDRMLAAVIVVVILIVVALLAARVLPVDRAGGQPKAETSTGDSTSGLAGKENAGKRARLKELLDMELASARAFRDAKARIYVASGEDVDERAWLEADKKEDDIWKRQRDVRNRLFDLDAAESAQAGEDAETKAPGL